MKRAFSAASLLAVLLTAAQPGLAQQSGAGLRIMEPEADGICKDEAAADDGAASLSRKQAAMLQEMMEVLKRAAAIQKKLSEGPGPAEKKEIRAELGRLMERTDRMMSELQAMMRGARRGP